MIEVKSLTKQYGAKKAVDDISFTVQDGEILGFLGPNGAGKSTTMNILTGYISSTQGQALINGIDILENPSKAKMNIGYLPELPPLYLDMTVKDYLDFAYDLKKCKLAKKPHIDEICKLVKITDVYNRIIGHLSKGYKQRVGLAQALIGNPPILILDEPTVGLDPMQIIEIRTLIKKLGKRHTVILSSHILSEIQAVCDRIVIINNGKIVADDTTENLTGSLSDDHRLIVRIEGSREEILKVIEGIKGVRTVLADMEREKGAFDYEIDVEEGVDIRRELFRRIADRNWTILSLTTAEMTLEDIFLRITTGEEVEIPVKSTISPEEAEKAEKKNKKSGRTSLSDDIADAEAADGDDTDEDTAASPEDAGEAAADEKTEDGGDE